ncbi:unnamed protein product [Cylindrotheca closterium]|uniref:UBR-type domain-containing protein n=1 Tax=Cylindrotheca closterium TaxID=2856 RepID=A0AAD2CBM0_9STRA|nr:unnamed protein product [Cylindrotheca closterium]
MSKEVTLPQSIGLVDCNFDTIAQILSFCDILDVYHLLSSSKRDWEQPISTFFSAQKAVSFSCLLKIFRNKIGNGDDEQHNAVIRLVTLLQEKNLLKHVEFSGMRQLSGSTWLPQLQNRCKLQTLDLSGCASLDPDTLETFLNGCPTSLRGLSLKGCIRVGASVVGVIRDCHQELESLSLGGCSISIDNSAIYRMFFKLSKLKDLDLQALKRLKDPILFQLPASIQSINLSSCEGLRLRGTSTDRMMLLHLQDPPISWENAPISRHKVRHLVLDAIGTPRRGLLPGALTYFALGRQLREVHLSGCEHIRDLEIQVLAEVCRGTLTVVQMRACRIGNAALVALGTHCTCLTECDFSACFQVSDEGVIALCRNKRLVHDRSNPKRLCHRSTLKSLKIASLPLLSGTAVSEIASLDSLLVLDIRDCPKVDASALFGTVLQLRQLIDLNARGINNSPHSIGQMIRQKSANIPPSLRFVDQRVLSFDPPRSGRAISSFCCTVRTHSQRLNSTVPMQYMYHCVDCGLSQSVNRGICSNCVTTCHKNHRTYLGSFTRFYCDCPFSIEDDGTANSGSVMQTCRAIFPT